MESVEGKSEATPSSLACPEQTEIETHHQKSKSNYDVRSSQSNSGKSVSNLLFGAEVEHIESIDSEEEIIYDDSTPGENSREHPTGVNPNPSLLEPSQLSTSTPDDQSDEHLLGSEYPSSEQQAFNHLLSYDSSIGRYVCRWCGRTFDRISNLKRHVLLHSGIKPFKCLYCNYRAVQKVNVVQHVASRHRDEMRALLNNNINVNDMLVPSTSMES